MNKPEKQQILIFIIAILIVAAFVVFRYIPLARKTMALNQDKEELLTRHAMIRLQTKQMPLLYEKRLKLIEQVKDFDLNIPEKREFASLWEQIVDKMNELDLKDQLIQPGQEVSDGRLCCIPISIQCSGSLTQIFELIKSIENMKRIVRIESMELIGDQKNLSMVKMSASGKVYYRRPEDNKS